MRCGTARLCRLSCYKLLSYKGGSAVSCCVSLASFNLEAKHMCFVHLAVTTAMKAYTTPHLFALVWSLCMVPGTFSAYTNSSSTSTNTGDRPSLSDACTCTIVFSTTPIMWYNEVFNATGPTIVYTINEDTHSTIGSSLIPSNSSIVVATGTQYLDANQGIYIYTTINASFDRSLVVTQTNHFRFSYSFYHAQATSLSGGLINTQCDGYLRATSSLFPPLPYTSDVEYTSTYIGQPQFLEGAQEGLEDFDALAARVAKLIGAPSCRLIGAGGTGELKVPVSILTSSSTVYAKAEQTTSDAAAPGSSSQIVTTPRAAPIVVPSVTQASATAIPKPTVALEPIPESSPPETAPTLVTIPLPLPKTESSALDTTQPIKPTTATSPEQPSRIMTSPTPASNPVENTPPAVSQPRASANAPPADSPTPSYLQPTTISFLTIKPSPTPQTTIFFTLNPPSMNQMPTTPRTTTLFLGASSAPATIIILPSTSGFAVEGTTLTLGGKPATIASQVLSVGSSGLEILQASSAGAEEHPSAIIAIPLANPTVSTPEDGDDIGGAIASMLGLPVPSSESGAILNPVITVGTQPFAISAAQSGGVVIDRQTLTSGGDIVVAGSTLSLAPSGDGIVVNGGPGPAPVSASNIVITLGAKPLTASAAPDGVVIGTQTLTSGGHVVVDGNTISLEPGGSGFVVNGAPTPSPLPMITLGTKSLTISVVDGGVVVGSQTLTHGGNIVVDGNTLSLPSSGESIDVSGHTQTSAGGQSSGNGGGSKAGSATSTGSSPFETSSGGEKLMAQAWVIFGELAVVWFYGIV
ncbi:hypothetical protein QTJ16_001890 [Diplocarpon rosae]|uniref:Uncharacterized protein n=1 Tax=Diplocarpon rosae TaxID=946125 RepID=A0AAD9WEK0_9HELO|nr:hypothetical protein QTJ16_001890 [Diplocarpon rosae]